MWCVEVAVPACSGFLPDPCSVPGSGAHLVCQKAIEEIRHLWILVVTRQLDTHKTNARHHVGIANQVEANQWSPPKGGPVHVLFDSLQEEVRR